MTLKKKISLAVVVVVLVITIAFYLFSVNKSIAAVPFGGLILNVTYCTCSFNLLLTVGPPVGGNYIFQPGVTVPFPYGQMYRPGPWILGDFVPGGSCLMWVGKACAPLPSIGTILTAGTSL